MACIDFCNSHKVLTLDHALGFKVTRMSTESPNSLTIGRLAKLADVGIDTVRFYERRGLLPEPQRTASGYRLYTEATVSRLSFIRRAKDLGFSLEEIIALLELQDKGGTKATVKELTTRKLAQIENKIADLSKMHAVLKNLNSDCSGSGDVNGCPIIEALSENTNSET